MRSSLTEELNRECLCDSLVSEKIAPDTQRYYAKVPVYVSRAQIERMLRVIGAVEELVRCPGYRGIIRSRSHGIEGFDSGVRGVCMGYDFHLTDDGPKLIEVNTNAGGAMLGALLWPAQRLECPHVAGLVAPATTVEGLQDRLVAMFQSEWRRVRGNARLRRIAIVDDDPEQQFLYREFQLYQELFRRHGFECAVVDPRELEETPNALLCQGQPIDLLYNRLVDFDLSEPSHAPIHSALLAGKVVVTPTPLIYALYADKRNLIEWTRPELWEHCALSSHAREQLKCGIPETRLVTVDWADDLWRERKSWFFKPTRGYGSKAAYRGDKLTRSTYAEILRHPYVAQRLAVPMERWVLTDDGPLPLKYDVRCFVYDGSIQQVVARLYRGQTTNFRTVGGGFAPIFTEIESEERLGRPPDTS